MIHNYKYFFLYISLSILFLTFPRSSAHDKPQPQHPPGEGNKAPSPVNVHKADAPLPSNVNVPTTPPPTKVPSTPPTDDEGMAPAQGGSDESSSNISYGDCFHKVYAFGDSYTDTGNAELLGGLKNFVGSFLSRLHNGSLHGGFHQLPGNRQSDGRLLVDFLCEDLKLPYLQPFKKTNVNFSAGVNFAVAGATAFHRDFFQTHNLTNHPLMWKGPPLNFQTQVDWFQKYLHEMACKGKTEADCRQHIEGALFWIGDMGGNDYSRIFGSAVGSMKSITETTVNHVSGVINGLIEKGAKFIMVQGLPPIGCCPMQLSLAKLHDRDPMGCLPVINSVIQAHNDLLQKSLENFRRKCSDCTILYADMWLAYKHIISNAKKYNFIEPFKACCGAGGGPFNFNLNILCGSLGTSICRHPGSHIFWDGIHFTEAMYKHLAKLFFLKKGFTAPISFAEMIHKKRRMMRVAKLIF